MIIRQYRPDFIESEEELKECSFNTLQELVEIPFVKSFSESPGFEKFSHSANNLIAEYNGGKTWMVVGYLMFPWSDILPEWDHGIYETEIGDIPGTQVSWSCGNEVGLKDGRKLKRKRE